MPRPKKTSTNTAWADKKPKAKQFVPVIDLTQSQSSVSSGDSGLNIGAPEDEASCKKASAVVIDMTKLYHSSGGSGNDSVDESAKFVTPAKRSIKKASLEKVRLVGNTANDGGVVRPYSQKHTWTEKKES